MSLPEKYEDERRRSISTGEDREIVVVTEDDPIVLFLLKDLDQEWSGYCAEFRKSELHGSLETGQ